MTVPDFDPSAVVTPEAPAIVPATPAAPEAPVTPEAPAAPKAPEAPKAEPAPFKPITSQEEFNKAIGVRIGQVQNQYADYDDLKAKAEKLAQIEQAELSAIEQRDATIKELNDKLAAAEAEKQKREFENLRAQVAEAKGIPKALASRLTGTTQAELEADADGLLELLPKAPIPVATPKPTPAGGGKPAVDPDDGQEIDVSVVDRFITRGY